MYVFMCVYECIYYVTMMYNCCRMIAVLKSCWRAWIRLCRLHCPHSFRRTSPLKNTSSGSKRYSRSCRRKYEVCYFVPSFITFF